MGRCSVAADRHEKTRQAAGRSRHRRRCRTSRRQLAAVVPEVHSEADRPKTLGQSFKSDDILALNGDVTRAKRSSSVAGRPVATSAMCEGRGADIVPTSARSAAVRTQGLLDTIMNPSAGIAPRIHPYVVETDAGKVFAGFYMTRTRAHRPKNNRRFDCAGAPAEVSNSSNKRLADAELVLKTYRAGRRRSARVPRQFAAAVIHANSFKCSPYPNNKPDIAAPISVPISPSSFRPEDKYENPAASASMPGAPSPTKIGSTGPEIDLAQLPLAAKTTSSSTSPPRSIPPANNRHALRRL